jgi:hypothetical protein
LKFSDTMLYIVTLTACTIYISNEIRLDVLIMQRNW